ncbi:type II pantothenate kinase [Jeotgalicoccus halotolerans]|uniref:Pantothenate kinase n=1 Tax=Jeotgalicoccus halotolerans TaxID=157227 RepID=A0A3E0AWW1_9STAP|nr:type II pantothenate kinase [Jeotgalicoccus halotolerans]REG24218.1 pantothenate kinase [Jeotgalicoccus halotolerans]
MKIGIDAGGTLIKVAILDKDGRTFKKYPSSEIDGVISMLNKDYARDEIYLTGGKAEYIAEKLNFDVTSSIEFDATFRGLTQLLKEADMDLDRYVYLNVGTGTSFHQATRNSQKRVGGSGVGGGTMTGLSYLLTGIGDFDKIIERAKDGLRDNVDLKVHHIYNGRPSPIPGDLTASNFGNILNAQKTASAEDQLIAVIGLVAETVTAMAINLADAFDTKNMVFIGSTLLNNEVMTDIIYRYSELKNARAFVVPNGEYSGALGAIS